MLRCYAEDTQGRVHSLPAVCKVKISQSADVPADSLRLLLYGIWEEEYCRVFVYDEAEPVFTAVVDEQIVKVGENSFTELICRSTAAVLLDNEARPQNFVSPCADLVFRIYAAPYGFTEYSGDDLSFQGDFVVPKGVSCYEVLESFSKSVFGKSPKVKGDTVLFAGEDEKPALHFSDDSKGLPFTDFTHSTFRCRLLSRIYTKTREQGEYDTVVADEEAVKNGILRERYMDISSFADSSLSETHKAIEKAKKSSREISLVYPARLTDVIGASVSVSVGGKVYEGFEVKSLDYTLSKDSQHTKLTLCRKEKTYVDNLISG